MTAKIQQFGRAAAIRALLLDRTAGRMPRSATTAHLCPSASPG